jgi:hypothetical protein
VTQPAPSSLSYQTRRPHVRANVPGLVGFIFSIVGLVTCGLLSPIAAVLSGVGMRREPRGLAIAGLVIGIVGTLELAAIATIMGVGYFAAKRASVILTSTFTTLSNSEMASRSVLASTVGGALPEDADGNTAIVGNVDGWGRPFRYHKFNEWRSEIRSAGADGLFDTADDFFVPVTPPSTASWPAPATLPQPPALPGPE